MGICTCLHAGSEYSLDYEHEHKPDDDCLSVIFVPIAPRDGLDEEWRNRSPHPKKTIQAPTKSSNASSGFLPESSVRPRARNQLEARILPCSIAVVVL